MQERDNIMTDTETKLPKRTPAQRMFYRQYLPFIQEKVLALAPVSYLTSNQIKENWGDIIPWNTEFANNIVFQSKIFFREKISPSSPRAVNPEFLGQVIDIIIEHLMIYFMHAPHYKNSEKAAREFLEKKLKTENAFLRRAHVREQRIIDARERRAIAATMTSENEQPKQKTKRSRIQIKEYTDKFNEVKRAMRIDIEHIK